MIKLALVEDDDFIRETLKAFLEKDNAMEVSAFSSAESFISFLEKDNSPEIVLLDINLPGITGVEAIPKIKQLAPNVAIMMNSVLSDNHSIFTSLCSGATGYIDKETSLEKIKESILVMHAGGSPMTPAIARKVVEYFNPQKKIHEDLTAREMEVVQGIVDGLSYKLIADRYQISIDTVRKHINKIYRKLEINSKGELIARFHKF